MIGVEDESRRLVELGGNGIEELWGGIDHCATSPAIQMQVHAFVGLLDVIGGGPVGEMHMRDDPERHEPLQGPKHRRSVNVGGSLGGGDGDLVGGKVRRCRGDDFENRSPRRGRTLTEVTKATLWIHPATLGRNGVATTNRAERHDRS